MRFLRKIFFTILFTGVHIAVAGNLVTNTVLPEAPLGFVWQLIPEMSDEFDGTKLDESKWNDHIPTWRGRPPAEFLSKNVSVKGGNLRIKTSTHPNPGKTFRIAGGSVSGRHQQIYGYFESRIKASRVKMSTTFWLHSDRSERADGTCEKRHRIELDILEAIGGWPMAQWSSVMNSNTHYKPYEKTRFGCKGAKYLSKGNKYDAGVKLADDFHIYAAWWVSPNKFHFYFDGKKVGTVDVEHESDSRPFNGPMSLRMVAETYDWQVKFAPEGDEPYPTAAELDDAKINTIYYDYVRSFELVPSADNLIQNPDIENTILSSWETRGARAIDLPNTGSASMQVDPDGYARQKIRVLPNKTYEIAFFATNAVKGKGAKVSIIDHSGKNLVNIDVDTITFSRLSQKFNTGDSKEVGLSIENNGEVASIFDSMGFILRD